MFKRYLFYSLLLIAVGCKKEVVGPTPTPTPPANTDQTFTNPLLASGPDPWVYQKDGFYYYMHTSGDRIRIWKTKSMSKLNFAVPVTVWTKPSSGPNSENVWAPELHFFNNKWYIYYTAGSSDVNTSQRLFVLENSSADPTQGTWVDKGMLKDPAADFWAIDANLFTYNGSTYVLWSGHSTVSDLTQRIYIAKMQDVTTMATGRVEISTPTFTWETVGFPAVNEGPQVIINPAGLPVLVFSASSCFTDAYCLGMSALKPGGDPLVPTDWVKSQTPIFSTDAGSSAYGPGHCSFFKSPDNTENWLLYHANTAPNQGCGDVRNPRIQKFTWNSNGTINLGTPVKINIPIQKPSGEQ